MSGMRLAAVGMGTLLASNLAIFVWLKSDSAASKAMTPLPSAAPKGIVHQYASSPAVKMGPLAVKKVDENIPAAQVQPLTPKGGAAKISAALVDPSVRETLLARQKYLIGTTYGKLLARIDATPEEKDRFKQLLAEKQVAKTDAVAAAAEEKIARNVKRTGSYEQLIAKVQAPIEEQIKTLLGPKKYEEYQHYEASLPMRELAERAKVALSYTANPLTEAQLENVIDAMYFSQSESLQGNITGKSVALGGGLQLAGSSEAKISSLTLKALTSLLTPEQLAAFKRLKEIQDLGRSPKAKKDGSPGR